MHTIAHTYLDKTTYFCVIQINSEHSIYMFTKCVHTTHQIWNLPSTSNSSNTCCMTNGTPTHKMKPNESIVNERVGYLFLDLLMSFGCFVTSSYFIFRCGQGVRRLLEDQSRDHCSCFSDHYLFAELLNPFAW